MNYILIDASYYIFYRYHALCNWWKLAKYDNETDIPYVNERFIEKYKDTFISKINEIKNKLKIKDANIFVGKDCPKKNIWRNTKIENYKGGRAKTNYMKTLFDIAYDNNLFTKAGCKKIFEENNLEADDILAITSKYILSKYPDAKIWIITSDMDYLQLACENITLINLKYNKLTDSKVSFNDAKKDLFCKIVSGDKSDNIPSVFSKCGIKTAEKYYNDPILFNKKLETTPNAKEIYERNRIIIDFNNIPCEYVNNIHEVIKNII